MCFCALIAECCTPICAVIPHPCNLPCADNVSRRESPRVGLIGWTQASLSIRNALHAANVRIDAEPKGRWHTFGHGHETGRPAEICSFFDSLGAAIAWNEDQESYDPAQRFTNPIYLGIPTIGYARQASFRAYGSAFLCDNVECVRELLKRIRAGQLQDEFEALRSTVRRHVSWKATQMRYEALFDALPSATFSQAGVRRRFDDTYQRGVPLHAQCRHALARGRLRLAGAVDRGATTTKAHHARATSRKSATT